MMHARNILKIDISWINIPIIDHETYKCTVRLCCSLYQTLVIPRYAHFVQSSLKMIHWSPSVCLGWLLYVAHGYGSQNGHSWDLCRSPTNLISSLFFFFQSHPNSCMIHQSFTSWYQYVLILTRKNYRLDLDQKNYKDILHIHVKSFRNHILFCQPRVILSTCV